MAFWSRSVSYSLVFHVYLQTSEYINNKHMEHTHEGTIVSQEHAVQWFRQPAPRGSKRSLRQRQAWVRVL